jgi:hypothetical protein
VILTDLNVEGRPFLSVLLMQNKIQYALRNENGIKKKKKSLGLFSNILVKDIINWRIFDSTTDNKVDTGTYKLING